MRVRQEVLCWKLIRSQSPVCRGIGLVFVQQRAATCSGAIYVLSESFREDYYTESNSYSILQFSGVRLHVDYNPSAMLNTDFAPLMLHTYLNTALARSCRTKTHKRTNMRPLHYCTLETAWHHFTRFPSVRGRVGYHRSLMVICLWSRITNACCHIWTS